MKRKFCAAIVWAALASPGYAIDQWPGESDFNNASGPAVNKDNPYRQKPIVDYCFGSRQLPSGSRGETTLTPAEYSYCRHYQYEFPTRDVSCAGPNLP